MRARRRCVAILPLLVLLVQLALLISAAPAAAQAPGWSRGQQSLAISYDECLRRATSAAQLESYRIDYAAGNSIVGVKGVHTALLLCNPASDGTMAVNIVVASNGDGGGVERQRLQQRMESPGAPPPMGGSPCQGGGGYALTVDTQVVRAGGTVTVWVTMPHAAGSAWVGLFPPGQPGHLGQWFYVETLAPTWAAPFVLYTPGQYELRLLLDSGYDKIVATCLVGAQ